MSEEETPEVAAEETPEETQVEETAATEDEGGEVEEAGDTPAPEEGEEGEQKGLSEEVQEKINNKINKLTKAKYDALRDAEYWRNQALNNVIEEKEGDAPPKEEDFDDYDAYLDERARYVARQEFKTLNQKNKELFLQSEKERADQIRLQSFQEKAVQARVRYKNFDEVALSENVPYSDTMREIVFDSDISGDLAMYLGSNIGVAEKISMMTDRQAARALGMIEQQLSSPVSPRKVSKAPEPITPVGGGGQGAAQKNPDDMTVEEWTQWRNKNKSIR